MGVQAGFECVCMDMWLESAGIVGMCGKMGGGSVLWLRMNILV